MVEELLKAGAIINTQSLDGSMPLHDAVFSGRYQVIETLYWKHFAKVAKKINSVTLSWAMYCQ